MMHDFIKDTYIGLCKDNLNKLLESNVTMYATDLSVYYVLDGYGVLTNQSNKKEYLDYIKFLCRLENVRSYI